MKRSSSLERRCFTARQYRANVVLLCDIIFVSASKVFHARGNHLSDSYSQIAADRISTAPEPVEFQGTFYLDTVDAL